MDRCEYCGRWMTTDECVHQFKHKTRRHHHESFNGLTVESIKLRYVEGTFGSDVADTIGYLLSVIDGLAVRPIYDD